MNQITDIQPQKKDPKRVNIYLDGEFAFGISLESKIVNKLKINESLSQEQVKNLIFSDQVERLFEKAVKFLSFRPRSEKEVRDNLLQKLWKSDKGELERENFQKSVDEVVKKLEKIDLIDDTEFARWWVEQRTHFKKSSPRIIKSELFKKGVNKEIIEEVLSQGEIDPYQLAKEAAEKKLGRYKNLPQREFREKLGRYLGQKGFDWEVIKRVVDTLLQKS